EPRHRRRRGPGHRPRRQPAVDGRPLARHRRAALPLRAVRSRRRVRVAHATAVRHGRRARELRPRAHRRHGPGARRARRLPPGAALLVPAVERRHHARGPARCEGDRAAASRRPSASRSPRRLTPTRRLPVVVVGGLAAAAALLVLVVALVGGDDRAGEGGRADASSAASTVAAVGLEGECASVHAGHATMMWNAVMADEMVDAGCPWPYPPFDVPHAAPAPARSLDAPFEAHRYDEIWRMIGTRGHGVCEIRPVPDPPGEGFTFGFVYL